MGLETEISALKSEIVTLKETISGLVNVTTDLVSLRGAALEEIRAAAVSEKPKAAPKVKAAEKPAEEPTEETKAEPKAKPSTKADLPESLQKIIDLVTAYVNGTDRQEEAEARQAKVAAALAKAGFETVKAIPETARDFFAKAVQRWIDAGDITEPASDGEDNPFGDE